MVFSLSNFFRPKPSPQDTALHTLQQIRIEEPSLLSPGGIACLRADDPIMGFYNGRCPIRKHFKNVIERSESHPEEIILIDVIGCVNSKSPSTSFAEMAQIPWLSQKTNEIRFKNDLEPLFDAVFNGSYDCVAKADENPRIFRQEWDRKMWFANSGGSHRTTTLWELDRINHYPRKIMCDVVDFSVSPDARKIAEENSIFIFHSPDRTMLRDQIDLFESLGVKVDCDENPAFAHDKRPNCCLIISRSNFLYQKIIDTLSNAYDFSDWILNPCEEYKPAFVLPQRNLAFA